MTDFDMDCSETEDGWFEVKAFLTNDVQGWEGDITQVNTFIKYSDKLNLNQVNYFSHIKLQIL